MAMNVFSTVLRMNKAVFVFVDAEYFVKTLMENGLILDDIFITVSPLWMLLTQIKVSEVPP